ncbi:MAG: ribose 5-phosphate isomerase B [Mucilaginibacter polytrichastri]|nr:ribose 5-phosphate isomerase B [Mucilaginibacter polytrichastri]
MDKTLRIAIGSDHAGFELKQFMLTELQGMEVKDFGTHSAESADYPDFAHPVALAVEQGEADFGILICGSANGVAITANKHQGIRAGICWNAEVAGLVRQHNDANVLCLPARFISADEAKEITRIFFETGFEGGRHARRVGKIAC